MIERLFARLFYLSLLNNKMNILLIGSRGFIGSHLLKYFRKMNHVVWHADVVVDYKADQSYLLIDPSNANFKPLFEKQKYDICINCSGAASVPDSIKNPLRDFQLNIVNVFAMLDAIRTYQPKCKFINFSSAAVYGNPKSLPIKEESDLLPLSPYGKHKFISEQICREFYDNFGISTCSLRVFSAYGEGLFKQLFWDVFKKSQSENIIELYGTGNETRDFIYINDLVSVVDLVCHNGLFVGDSINVACGIGSKINDVISIFLGNFNREIHVSYAGKNREGDPLYWQANIDIIESMGFRAKYTLEEGLKNYFLWAFSQSVN